LDPKSYRERIPRYPTYQKKGWGNPVKYSQGPLNPPHGKVGEMCARKKEKGLGHCGFVRTTKELRGKEKREWGGAWQKKTKKVERRTC